MKPALPDFSEIVNSAPDGVIIVDNEGGIAFANARIASMFGYEPTALTGRRIEALVPDRFHSQHIGNRASYSGNPHVRPMGSPRHLFVGKRINDSEFPVEIHLAPIQQGTRHWTLAFIRDATDRHAIHEELKRSQQAAQDVARVKGEFLSLAAHDLSQPVQTLELVMCALQRNTSLPPDLDELASLASTSLGRMRELLKMLLDISRVESGTLQVVEQPVRIEDMFADMERHFGPIARAKTLTFSSRPCPRIIETDPVLLRGLLSNLVANATRYTARGEVSLECTAPADGSIHLAVHDTGLGIPQEQLGVIFDDFYRGPEAKHVSHDGFGLGLGIVRRLSKVLGFSVTVTSEIGLGSTFSIQIPHDKVVRNMEAMIGA